MANASSRRSHALHTSRLPVTYLRLSSPIATRPVSHTQDCTTRCSGIQCARSPCLRGPQDKWSRVPVVTPKACQWGGPKRMATVGSNRSPRRFAPRRREPLSSAWPNRRAAPLTGRAPTRARAPSRAAACSPAAATRSPPAGGEEPSGCCKTLSRTRRRPTRRPTGRRRRSRRASAGARSRATTRASACCTACSPRSTTAAMPCSIVGC
mmetsp:Transcript_34227/g.85883  ORF Transcript_34227/g.85883 Transcript_34227/m.85883 type:complete len:209 (-) Transcript_34227:719-1345(-)